MPNPQTVTVKPGDTLGKIAERFGTTVAAFAQANGITDADKIRVGQVLKIPEGDAPRPATPAATPAAPTTGSASHHILGTLSAKFETSGRGPGTVSGGIGDPGGVSYGSYQLASKLGRPAQFLAREGKRWASEFAGTVQGTPAFSAIWKKIANREPEAFHAAQHDYIQRTHYDVQVAHILAKTGDDVNKRSNAVRDAIWSTAVQHGPKNNIIVTALKGAPKDDRALLQAIYAERGRVGANGKLVHFPSASAAVRSGVANRFRSELRDALAMMAAGNSSRQ